MALEGDVDALFKQLFVQPPEGESLVRLNLSAIGHEALIHVLQAARAPWADLCRPTLWLSRNARAPQRPNG